MTALIVFIIITVSAFSRRYMAGDRYYRRHAGDIFVLGACVLVMVSADHAGVFLIAWSLSNLYLVRLMVHKKEWRAARNSGRLALKTFGLGFAALAVAFGVLYHAIGSASIHQITAHAEAIAGGPLLLALSLIALAALTQSGIWPFHRWLTSSLNSPTPVSALMHAGLVNGGGFLLVRFAPLFLAQPMVLKTLFVAGMLTAVMGTFWKLMQTDVKRMLACSTMGQMGFMIAQCGMGLFAGAVSHLLWHGLFKAYLFLASGSAVQEKRTTQPFASITPKSFLAACASGAIGAVSFAHAASIALGLSDTGAIMIGLAFMASTQLACTILKKISPSRMVFALAASAGAGWMYGISIAGVDHALASLHLWQPQPLDSLYIAGFSIVSTIWLAMNMNLPARLEASIAWKRLYMTALNSSQPHPQTITATRTAYRY